MTTRLGVYWSVMHRRPQDYGYMRSLSPTVVKVMDGGQPDYAWLRANLPNALILARDWALSEQHDDMRHAPTRTGIRHALEWAAKVGSLGFDPTNTLVLGINEPRVWEGDMSEAVIPYTVAFLDECRKVGLRGGALQLSVGWPANSGSDTPPDWNRYAPIEDAIKRGRHALVLHEYWADAGPGEMWGWWGGRSLKCPWNVPIIIGECGIDLYVKRTDGQHSQRGWRSVIGDPARYASELADYVNRMSDDARFVGCCVFAMDFANREWESFDTEPAHAQIVLAAPQVKNNTVHIPVVGTPPAAPVAPSPAPVVKPALGIIDPVTAAALLAVESGGQAFGADGRPIIRFEAHIFKNKLRDDALFDRHFSYDSEKPWVGQIWRPATNVAWRSIHTGKQADQWIVFEFAKTLNAEAAAQSISVGAAQIMGFNHTRIGYTSATAMLKAFSASEQNQTIGFINFILSDSALWAAVNLRDWRTVAKLYNGTGQIDRYAQLLQDAYARLSNA